jgi:hypothetical protein
VDQAGVTRTGDVNGRRIGLGTRLTFKGSLMRAVQFGTYIKVPKPGAVVDKRRQAKAASLSTEKGI